MKRVILVVVVFAALPGLWWLGRDGSEGGPPVRVGILHSPSGTMAISERSVAAATQLAIDEINAGGGVLGRRIEAVTRDGASDWPTFARQAEALIVDEKVDVVFGCWTSASRKMVRPVFERHDHLLFYLCSTRGWSNRRTSSIPARRPISRSFRPSNGPSIISVAASSSSARTTSFRMPRMPS